MGFKFEEVKKKCPANLLPFFNNILIAYHFKTKTKIFQRCLFEINAQNALCTTYNTIFVEMWQMKKCPANLLPFLNNIPIACHFKTKTKTFQRGLIEINAEKAFYTTNKTIFSKMLQINQIHSISQVTWLTE